MEAGGFRESCPAATPRPTDRFPPSLRSRARHHFSRTCRTHASSPLGRTSRRRKPASPRSRPARSHSPLSRHHAERTDYQRDDPGAQESALPSDETAGPLQLRLDRSASDGRPNGQHKRLPGSSSPRFAMWRSYSLVKAAQPRDDHEEKGQRRTDPEAAAHPPECRRGPPSRPRCPPTGGVQTQDGRGDGALHAEKPERLRIGAFEVPPVLRDPPLEQGARPDAVFRTAAASRPFQEAGSTRSSTDRRSSVTPLRLSCR